LDDDGDKIRLHTCFHHLDRSSNGRRAWCFVRSVLSSVYESARLVSLHQPGTTSIYLYKKRRSRQYAKCKRKSTVGNVALILGNWSARQIHTICYF
jgi:hypothetical protein